MIVLLIFAFLAGIVTILSPCILPVLPIILVGSVGSNKRHSLGIIFGFIVSFTFFTLFLSVIVKNTGISGDVIRYLAILFIGFFGLSLVIPKLQIVTEQFFSRFTVNPKTSNGFLLGMSLGLVWTPCVGPILASIIALALTGTVTSQAVLITLAYAIGTSIPMFAILYGGRTIVQKIPNPRKIQKIFGYIMVFIAFGMYFNLDRTFQLYIIKRFPNYGSNLTKIETLPWVTDALKIIQKKPIEPTDQGKPMFDLIEPAINPAPEITGGQEWFNSEPLTLASLKGKVVLIDFWTYTCINCIRTFPYTKAWWEKYKDKGFVLIGVHTPEFEFEKNASNVKKAIADFGITYPVVQDNNYTIWSAYNNRYWPAHYLIDKRGVVSYTHFGEGAYDETEAKIQELLNVELPIDNLPYEVNTRTPETYLGTARGVYTNITTTGTWTKSEEYAMPTAGATLTYRFDATHVYLVMRPTIENTSGKLQVFLDGTFQKDIVVDSDKLYTLISLPVQGKHELLLKFLDSNLELYAFTFG